MVGILAFYIKKMQTSGFLLSRHSIHIAELPIGGAPCKGGVFKWGESNPAMLLQPEAIRAVMEVTKLLIALGKRGGGGT